jgi:hypothetical protein
LGPPCPRLLPPFVFAQVASVQCLSLEKEQVALLCPTLTQKLCTQQYPIGSQAAWWLSNGRVCAAQLLLRGWTARLRFCNGLSEIGNDFCLLLVRCNQLVNRIVLLDGSLCQVVQQCTAIFSAWTISCAAA